MLLCFSCPHRVSVETFILCHEDNVFVFCGDFALAFILYMIYVVLMIFPSLPTKLVEVF
jgi:hypothetical protein